MDLFEVNRQTRLNVLKVISGLNGKQLNHIPEGYSNNLIWHLGHIIATQQLLVYGLSDEEFLITENIIEEFRKGTKPETLYEDEDIDELISIFIEVIERTEKDYQSDEILFDDFKEYPTSYGITLKGVDDAIQFNNVHEGLHLGMMMAMKKLV